MPSGRPSETVKSGVIAALAQVVLLWSSAVSAHDASAWGGLFRSRDHGATWFLASPGTFPTAAIALAVSPTDRKSTRLNSSHLVISYAVFCLKKKYSSNVCDDHYALSTAPVHVDSDAQCEQR